MCLGRSFLSVWDALSADADCRSYYYPNNSVVLEHCCGELVGKAQALEPSLLGQCGTTTTRANQNVQTTSSNNEGNPKQTKGCWQSAVTRRSAIAWRDRRLLWAGVSRERNRGWNCVGNVFAWSSLRVTCVMGIFSNIIITIQPLYLWKCFFSFFTSSDCLFAMSMNSFVSI